MIPKSSSFGEKTTDEAQAAFAQLKAKNPNMKGLVLDLRGNPGGYLEAAVDMASWFLPSGDVVVQEDYGSGKDKTVYKSLGHIVQDLASAWALYKEAGELSS